MAGQVAIGPMHRPEFREQGMSYRDFVRDVVGNDDLLDGECDAILWELTPFPLAQGRDDLRPHLEAVRDGTRTFESVYAEMDAAVAAAHPEDEYDPVTGREERTVAPRREPPGVVTRPATGGLV